MSIQKVRQFYHNRPVILQWYVPINMSRLCKLYFDRTGSIFVKMYIDHYLYFKNDNRTTSKLELLLLEYGNYMES